MKVTMLRNIITQLTITDPTVRMLDSRHMTVTMLRALLRALQHETCFDAPCLCVSHTCGFPSVCVRTLRTMQTQIIITDPTVRMLDSRHITVMKLCHIHARIITAGAGTGHM
jgi:hypothetical protein